MRLRAALTIGVLEIAQVMCGQSIVNINGTAHSYMTCYSNGIDSLMTYQDSASNYPILLRFCEGQMQACCDRVTIYDGLDVNAPVLYWGNGVNGDLTGLLVVGTNGDAALTVSITADSSISCMDQGYPIMKWVVYPQLLAPQNCVFTGVQDRTGDVGPSITPVPAQDHLSVELPGEWAASLIVIFDASGRQLMSVRASGGRAVIDINTLVSGQYYAVIEGDGDSRAMRPFMVVD